MLGLGCCGLSFFCLFLSILFCGLFLMPLTWSIVHVEGFRSLQLFIRKAQPPLLSAARLLRVQPKLVLLNPFGPQGTLTRIQRQRQDHRVVCVNQACIQLSVCERRGRGRAPVSASHCPLRGVPGAQSSANCACAQVVH